VYINGEEFFDELTDQLLKKFFPRWNEFSQTLRPEVRHVVMDTEMSCTEIQSGTEIYDSLCQPLLRALKAVRLSLIVKSTLERLASNLVSTAARDNIVYGLSQMLVCNSVTSQDDLT
jgi:hypothetical protein